MLKYVDAMMPKDRPMEVHKTDARPFGVFDVNEGSKKGIIELFDGIRERSTLTKTQWAAKTCIVQGDWLSTNNYRNARRIRRDDIDAFERMDHGEDLTGLFTMPSRLHTALCTFTMDLPSAIRCHLP
ncbi:hypothetical protein C8J57DRAFT_1610084 [Mycena rebaudengoi]|nr:hypothetical protein C8J57DRAFT_1610084 [Mycena rebaudengoi]